MTQLIQKKYNLTEYIDFRTLQLEYCKIKDENQQLKSKIEQIQSMYEQGMRIGFEERKQRLMEQNQQTSKNDEFQKYRAQQSQLISKMLLKINSYDEDEIIVENQCEQSSPSLFVSHLENSKYQNEKLKKSGNIGQLSLLESKINMVLNELRECQDNFIKLAQQNQQRQKVWLIKQEKNAVQFSQLQLNLEKLENFQQQLDLENKKLNQGNQELWLQLKSYKAIAIQARQNKKINSEQDQAKMSKNNNIEDDVNFTLDILGYEKQLLVRVYQLIQKSFHDEEIEICINKIYLAYEDLIDAYRQKVQIQYDLEDLECQYRKQKKHSRQDQALIDLKKQINKFRKQLQTQKETLYQKQNILQEKVKDLSGQSVHDHRLKSYTINLHSRLHKQKKQTMIQEKEEKKTNLNKKIDNLHYNSQQQQNNIGTKGQLNQTMGRKCVEWKQTMQADKMMQNVIDKDRQNLQNILRQTRSKFYKKNKG